MAPRPEALYRLHQLLISMGIAMSAIVIVYSFVMYPRTHDRGTVMVGGLAAFMMVALSLYLRWFRQKHR